MRRRYPLAVAAAALALGGVAASTMPVGAATSATAVINGVGASGGSGSAGSAGITVTAGATIDFGTITLNGTNQTINRTLAIDLNDSSGNGAGWNVQATSTAFQAGTKYLPNTATTLAAPSWACTGGSTCTLPTNSLSYPITLPAAQGAAPAAIKVASANANTGMGDQNSNFPFTLTVPGNALAGSYSSTWTITAFTGP